MRFQTIEELQEEWVRLMPHVERLLYPVRAIELQEVAVEKTSTLLDDILKLKQVLKSDNKVDQLTSVLLYELLAHTMLCELRMWICIKNEKYDDAWDNLVSAQESCSFAYKVSKHKNLYNRMKNYAEKERILFPSQVFSSVGLLVKKSKCSVCDKLYKYCDHEKGYIYSGEICSEIVLESEVEEISIVENPQDRRCRALIFQGRDTMTYRKVDDVKGDGTFRIF